MSEESIVVEGAICKCQFGNKPDKIKVISHQKEYANDGKLMVTTLEIGAATLEANCFGTCPKLGSPPPPCKPVITEWQDFYEEVTLSNGGQIILKSSRAICAVAGSACIEFMDDGQIEEIAQQNFDNADEEMHSQLNPLIDIADIGCPEPLNEGIIIKL
ncbi:MAG: DUF4280 domain-containing protein [Dysgonomonas sp.]